MKKDETISMIKKTLGKDGKYYHYESLTEVKNVKEVYWYKISESYYKFHIDKFMKNALKIEYNANREIIYMEYERKPGDLLEEKRSKGCTSILVLSIIVLSILSLKFLV